MNAWLDINNKRLTFLLRHIEEYRLKGSYGGSLNLSEITLMMKGAITEIHRLENQINQQRQEIKNLKDEINKIHNEITDVEHNDLLDKIDTLKNKFESVNKLFRKPEGSGIREVK